MQMFFKVPKPLFYQVVEPKSSEDAVEETIDGLIPKTPVYCGMMKVNINEGLQKNIVQLTSEDGTNKSELSRVLTYGGRN
jgi:hypothetical protein